MDSSSESSEYAENVEVRDEAVDAALLADAPMECVSSESTELYWRREAAGARRFLPGEWSQIRLYLEAKLHDEQECIAWCIQVGILPSTKLCRFGESCRRRPREMVRSFRPSRNYHFWRCSFCRAEVPLAEGTIFKGSHLEMRMNLLMAYCFAHQMGYEETRRSFVWSAEASSPAEGTVSEWFSSFREVIVAHTEQLQMNGGRIGGQDIVVQVDEALIGRRKYNRGRVVQGTWVIGMIDESGEIRLEICARRDANTLGDIVSRHVQPGSIVHTDCWRGYQQLTDRGFVHHQVNHSQEFVAPDGTHTQRIEAQWRAIRRRFSQGGIRHEDIADYLVEYAWRRKCRRENMDPFVSLIIALKLE